MRSWKFFLPLLATSLCFAVQPDRIFSPIDSSQMVRVKGNVHGLAHAGSDLGRSDGGKLLYGVSLVFHPSAAQQKDLDNLLAQQQDRSSPNYHKWLTPAQFGERFGMTQTDLSRVVAWLESRGFTVTSIPNSRNQISFDGTVAQVESAFSTEIHNYLVDGEIHFANATDPSVPAALAGSVLSIGHLHNFAPKPRVRAQSHFTSAVTGNHFLTPGDFATIYDLTPLYNASPAIDGTGEKIAIIGQSTVNLTDLSNFRNAAGLVAKAPTLMLYPSTSTPARCPGDELESDLDLEYAGGVAKNASIIFVYAGLVGSDKCGSSRQNSVWEALHAAVDTNVAPVISTSYGFCESGLGQSFSSTVRGWAQQANIQGQTIVAASGDAGAADCDPTTNASATGGLAVDVPASIPEVTGMGGTEFNADNANGQTQVVGGNAVADLPYWSGTTGGNDDISSALEYIPGEAWNDTVADKQLAASGGGASIYFTKQAGEAIWQVGPGVPADGVRDVPDLALNAALDHDPYLICSEDGPSGTIVATCTSGFRDGTGGNLTFVGGTSAAAPTFAAIVALLDQYLKPYLKLPGLSNVNLTLYQLAVGNPDNAFQDITSGDNFVPCTSGTPNCPAGTTQYGFNAGVGYDQVTGLGSVDAFKLASAWKASIDPDFSLSASPLTPSPVSAGTSATSTLTISPISGSIGKVVNFSASNPSSCTGLPAGATCSFNPSAVTFDGINDATTVLTITTLANMTLPAGAQTVTITPTNSAPTSTTVSLTVTATTQSFTLSPPSSAFTVAAGGKAPISITVSSGNGFIGPGPATNLPLTYTCSGLPSESQCSFSPLQTTSLTQVTVSIQTTAPIAKLSPPQGRGNRIFYALLLPGLFGIVFAAGSRTRGARLLSMIAILGFCALSLTACGGSNSSQKDPGTPPGTYAVVVNATTGGANPLTGTSTVNLTVTP
jgi:subtilase family serine protease